jgi:hypothetical protein
VILLPEPTNLSPIQLFIRTEILAFNALIEHILASPFTLPSDKIPSSWRNLACFSYSDSATDFLTFIMGKRSFLCNLSDKTTDIDCRFLNNTAGLLQSFMQERASEMNCGVDGVELKVDTNPGQAGALVLTDLWIVGSLFEDGIVRPTDKAVPINKLPPLRCLVIRKRETKVQNYLCPFFRSPPSRMFVLERDMERIDGETRNFIGYLPLPTKLSDVYLVANSVSVVCQVPTALSALMVTN